MLLTHVSNFVHKSPKMTKVFRRFREEIAPVWVKTVVVFGLSIFIKSLIYQLSSLVLEIFFQWVVILKFLILFCVWSIYVFSAPFLKKVYLTVYSCNPEGRIFYWFEVKKVNFMWDFKLLYLKKYSSYEKIINMKNVQNHPNFLKK